MAAADPCAIVELADQALAAGMPVSSAQDLLALEKNFRDDPGETLGASVCDDPALPASDELRGFLPLVDPQIPGAAEINTLTAKRNEDIKSGAVDGVQVSDGKSIADQMVELGFDQIRDIGSKLAISKGAGQNGDVEKPAQDPADDTTGNPETTEVETGDGNSVEDIINEMKSDIVRLKSLLVDATCVL